MYQEERNQHLLKKVLAWSSLEGILFQAILVIHNLFLFKKIPITDYGKMGLIFSVAYSLAYLMVTGFDIFYMQAKVENENAKVKTALLSVQIVWIAIIFFMFNIIGHFFMQSLLLAFALGFAEALKRTFKIITLTHHRFACVTSYELLHLTMYCSSIWGFYFLGYQLKTTLLITPLVITTSACALIYAFQLTYLWHWPPYNFFALLRYRVLLCIGTLYHILFSGNIMTPLAYMALGPVYAAGIKLASTCTHGIISIIERALTTSANLLCDPEDSKFLYKFMGQYVWLATAVGTILSGLLVGYTIWQQNCYFLLPYAALYIILHIAGIVSVLCERVLLAESPSTAPYLTLISSISIGFSIFLGTYTPYPLYGIILFVLTRIVLSIGLGIKASRRIDPAYFTIMSQNLIFLFCALFLCVFFMRQ